MKLVEKLKEISNQTTDWSEDAHKQIKTLINIIESDSKEIVIKNNDYYVYRNGQAISDQKGKIFTLDVNELLEDTEDYIDMWTVPTKDSHNIDLWLI